MTRVLLTWLGLAVLQLGIPRGMTAAELRRVSESTRVVPASELPGNGALVRDLSRSHDPRTAQVPPFAPVAPARISPTALRAERPVGERQRSPATVLAALFPEARAPPA